MNKLLIHLLSIFFFTFQVACAQSHTIKTNLLGIIQKKIGLSYEFVPSQHFSIALGGGISYQKQINDEFGKSYLKENGYFIVPEIRYYPNNQSEAPNGLFFGATAYYEALNIVNYNESIDSLNATGKVTNLGGGIIAGYQWIFGEHLVIELFINPYYNQPSISGNITQLKPVPYELKEGIQFNRLGLSLGFAF